VDDQINAFAKEFDIEEDKIVDGGEDDVTTNNFDMEDWLKQSQMLLYGGSKISTLA